MEGWETGRSGVRTRPGDTIYTPPGEEHWHGAAPDSFMEHLALWESPGPDGGPETAWGDKVTDTGYQASARRDIDGDH